MASKAVAPLPAPRVRAGSLRAWLLACRPQTLTAAVAPVLVGSACAHASGQVRVGAAVGALAGAMLLQIGANLANDVFDFEKGADTSDRLGPTRVVQSGLLDAARVRRGMWLVFSLALAAGAYLTVIAGPAVVVIGLASIAAALAYTGGPYPLGYHGLGDLFVFVFFGLVAVAGTCFVEIGRVPPLAVAASVPVGALATAILVVNNLRDRETDARAGKRTLAVRLGPRGALVEYFGLLGAAYLVPFWVAGRLGAVALLPLASLPLAAHCARLVTKSRGRELNAALAGTAQLLLAYAVLFALGVELTVR
jgi:1,4-dihydroxy-2-naphthoate polyprenyltransferase